MLYWTRLIDSRPPPTATAMPSTMMRWAAMLIAMRPELQNRLMVSPGTVTGSPARIAASRAILWPVAPSGLAQPRMTSSTSPGATFARSTAFWITCPARVAPWVLLKAPRTAAPIGGAAFEHHATMAHYIEPVRDAQGDGQLLLDEEDGDAALGDALQEGGDALYHLRRQALRRLIDHDHVGIAHERSADREHLLLAAGQHARGSVGALPQHRKKIVRVLEAP